MEELYFELKKWVLNRFPLSRMVSETDPASSPQYYSCYIDVHHTPPCGLMISRDNINSLGDSIMLSVYPVIYLDEAGKYEVTEIFTDNGTQFTGDKGYVFFIKPLDQTSNYEVLFIDLRPSGTHRQYKSTFDALRQKIESLIAVENDGRPYGIV